LIFSIEVTASARRALTHDLPEAAAVACREFIRGPLAKNSYRVGKPLRGRLEGLFAARRGEFRVVYEILDERIVVRVVNIDHRRNVYG
jgi:mRNA interferase RelE/StbE